MCVCSLLLIGFVAYAVFTPERNLGWYLLAIALEDVAHIEGRAVEMQRDRGVRMAGILHAMQPQVI